MSGYKFKKYIYNLQGHITEESWCNRVLICIAGGLIKITVSDFVSLRSSPRPL